MFFLWLLLVCIVIATFNIMFISVIVAIMVVTVMMMIYWLA